MVQLPPMMDEEHALALVTKYSAVHADVYLYASQTIKWKGVEGKVEGKEGKSGANNI